MQYGIKIEKNGSQIKENYNKGTANERGEVTVVTIIDMNGSTDYVEFYCYPGMSSGTPSIGNTGNNMDNFFGAFRIG